MKIQFVKHKGLHSLSAKESKAVAVELKKIQKRDTTITPRAVVTFAEDRRSPLHKYFEWNDTVAADKYRQWQARYLICSVYVQIVGVKDCEPVRAFVNCSPVEDDEDPFLADRGYVFTASIAGRQSYEAQVLDYARNQLLGWRKRFGNYKEFLSIAAAIDRL